MKTKRVDLPIVIDVAPGDDVSFAANIDTVSTKQYWSATVYDRLTHTLVKNLNRANRVSNDAEVWVLPDIEEVKMKSFQTALTVTCVSAVFEAVGSAQTVPVTVENFRRAESDKYFASRHAQGGFGKLSHLREPMPIEHQTVIRGNRDTLYSSGVFDLDAGPLTVTLPEHGSRYMSMLRINEDEYCSMLVYDTRPVTFTREQVGTRYTMIGIRTLYDPRDAKDVEEAHRLQDAIKVEQPGGPGTFEVPNWDAKGRDKLRTALITLGETVPDSRRMFGSREQVDPVLHLIGAAMAWGGNNPKDALYLNRYPAANDGKTVHRLIVKDVPVDAFWSISIYNAEGYFQKNDQNAYSINSITAKKEADGSVVIQFGVKPGSALNILPIPPGWNYMVRLYRPHAEILDGTWLFPEARPVN